MPKPALPWELSSRGRPADPGRDAAGVWLAAAAALIAAAFLLLSLIGAAHRYSPVPYFDDWDAGLRFMMDGGGWRAWWNPHNEHRIVLTRALIWVDYTFFSGTGRLLIAMNFVAVGLSILLFGRILKEQAQGQIPAWGLVALTMLFAAWLLQWMQYEAIAWGLNIHFYLVLLLPLAGLFLLQASTRSSQPVHLFLAATALGWLAIGTMANGVLALPLMAAYAFVSRQPRVYGVVLAINAAIAWALFFHGHGSAPAAGGVPQAITTTIWPVLTYILLYLGSPAYHLADGGSLGIAAAMGASLVLLTTALMVFGLALRRPALHSLDLVLLFFLAFVVIGAAGAASGRLAFGVEQALSSRYLPSSLMAWLAWALLLLPRARGLGRRGRIPCLAAGALLLVLMAREQLKALRPFGDKLFEREVALLAVVLGVRDKDQIDRIYPYGDGRKILDTGRDAIRDSAGLPGSLPYRRLGERLGQVSRAGPAANRCRITGLEQGEIGPGEPRFVAVEGSMVCRSGDRGRRLVALLSPEQVVIGYAALAAAAPRGFRGGFLEGLEVPFKGYALKQAAGTGGLVAVVISG